MSQPRLPHRDPGALIAPIAYPDVDRERLAASGTPVELTGADADWLAAVAWARLSGHEIPRRGLDRLGSGVGLHERVRSVAGRQQAYAVPYSPLEKHPAVLSRVRLIRRLVEDRSNPFFSIEERRLLGPSRLFDLDPRGARLSAPVQAFLPREPRRTPAMVTAARIAAKHIVNTAVDTRRGLVTAVNAALNGYEDLLFAAGDRLTTRSESTMRTPFSPPARHALTGVGDVPVLGPARRARPGFGAVRTRAAPSTAM